jgi:hypothetical protein
VGAIVIREDALSEKQKALLLQPNDKKALVAIDAAQASQD